MTHSSYAFESPTKISWLLRGLPWLILTGGMLLVLLSWHYIRDQTIKQQQFEFNLLFDRLTLSIENQLKANEQVLRGVVGLFDASGKVERSEFRAYVASLKLEELYPGILGIGFSKLIDPNDLAKHIKSVRAEGFPNYSVNPPGQRDIYTSIIYLEPFNWRNQRAFGYDMYSDSIRQEAMAKAQDTGLAALSGKVTLQQEVEKDMQAGVLLYVPIYQHNAKGEANNLIGWAYSPLRMKDLMSRLLDREHPDFFGRIAIAIYDGLLPEPASLLFKSLSSSDDLKSFHLTRQIELAGHVWTVSANTLPGFVDRGMAHENAFLIAGLLVTVLLASLVGTLSRGHARMAAAAGVLRQFKAIVDSTSDAIISKALDGTIKSWNYGAELIFGYRAEEVIGQSIQMIIPIDRQDEEIEILAGISRGERVEPFETIRIHKDGRLINISETISPLMDNAGKVVGSSKIARDITEHKQSEMRLKESEERLTLATIHNGVGIWDWDLQTKKMIWDNSMFSLYQLRLEDFSGAVDAWEKSLHPDDRERCDQEIKAALSGEKDFDTDFRVIGSKGNTRYIKAVAKVFRDRNGLPLRMLGTNIDITELKQAELKLQLAAKVFSHAREGIMITDAAGTIIEVNDTFTRITGYSYDEAVGQNPSLFKSGRQSPEFYSSMWQDLLDKGHWYGEIWNRHKSGKVYAVMITISAVRDDLGQTQNYVALFTDITQIKEHQQELEHIAHYDALTCLPNRVLLTDRLNQAMIHSERRHEVLGLVYLDLDGFKAVNDNYDHQMGDELLIAISLAMKEALREGDTLARIGGDEFIAVLVDLERISDCDPVLERLLQAASTPVAIENLELQLSASIGVTFYPQDNVDADQLIRHADQAMYIAKQDGKNRFHVFDIFQDAAIKTQQANLEDIRSALDKGEFVLHYQPKVNIRNGRVIGAEALIRWQHSDRGLLAPAEFLPIIENHPIEILLGEWVIDTALKQIRQWQSVGLHLPISVNIGAKQFQQADFVERVSSILALHADIQTFLLEFEVLETSAMEDLAAVSDKIKACREMGLRFALDDFGTGFSSLTYLRHLPVDIVKIDQSFVRDMLDDPDDLTIVNGVIGLATNFSREVIAEGVESKSHAKMLLSIGCDLAQGYGIARPMPATDMPDWVNQWHLKEIWKA